MPYISDAERERAQWMTLAEAVGHVEEHDGCDRPALKQLCDALGDRKIRKKFQDQKPNRSIPDGMIISPDWPPDGDTSFWRQALINGDKVFDHFNRERVLLLLRFDVERIWRSRTTSKSAAAENGKTEPATKLKDRGRPGAEIDIHPALDRLLERGCSIKDMRRKELWKLVDKECNRGWCLRAKQKHLASWLKKH